MADYTPIKGKIRRKPFLVLDLESKHEGTEYAGFTTPFMAGVYGAQIGYHPFYNKNEAPWFEGYYLEGGCIDRAMRYLLRADFRGYHIYAHNGGKFDYLFLLPWLMHVGVPMLGYRFSIIPVASDIQVLDVWHSNNRQQNWRFLDSIKLLPTSLDKAAKAFGLPGKVSHDLHVPSSNRALWNRYNKQDCIQNYLVVEKFHDYVEKVLLSDVGITTPATAIRLHRRRFLKEPIPRNEPFHEFCRKSYYGGRTEMFISQGIKLRYYDFNSCYPAVMQEPMPGGSAVEFDNEPPQEYLDNKIGYCNVDVIVPEALTIPPLPVKGDGKDNGPDKLIFPVGRLTGHWDWHELKQAIAMGCQICKWHKSAWFEPVDMFGEYVRELYKYRNPKHPDYKPGLEEVVKRLLNGTYGKYGMRTLRKKIYLAGDPEMPEKCYSANGEPDCPIWYGEEEVDAAYIMPQVSAHVTALARVKLLQRMLEVLNLGGRVYYCDTDSIICDVIVPTSSELGDLKDEVPQHSGNLCGLFVGPKLYKLFTEDGLFEQIRAKGMQRHTRIAITWPEAQKLAQFGVDNRVCFDHGGSVDFEALPLEVRKQMQWYKRITQAEALDRLREGLAVDQFRIEKVGTLARNGFDSGPKLINVPKRVLQAQGKRIMLEDGSYGTTPYKLEMW